MACSEPRLQIGDKYQLKSGSPILTIVGINENGNTEVTRGAEGRELALPSACFQRAAAAAE